MRRLLLLFVAGILAIPVFPATRSASAAEASQAPERAAPASPAPSASAPGAEAPAMEQRRVRTRPTARQYSRPHQTRTYRSPGPTYYRSYPYYRSYHYHYTPPVVYSPPVVVVEPAPPVVYYPPVVVQQPVVYQQPVAYATPTPVVYEEPAAPSRDAFGASFLVHFLGVNESDTDLAFQTIEGATLFGANGALRFDVDTHWMLEAALGILGSESRAGVRHLQLPLSLSAIAHLFPGSIVDPYGVAGLSVIFNEYDDPAYADIEQYTQFAGHLGFGTEINLGESFLISADLRFLFMNPRPERDSQLALGSDGVSVRDGTGASAPTVVNNSNPDRLQTALQFQIGAGWRF
jgi:hypothetical protein